MILATIDYSALWAHSEALRIAGISLMSMTADSGLNSPGPSEFAEMAAIAGWKAATLPRWVWGGSTVAGHLLMFASLPDVGTIMAAITGLCVGLLGLYVTGMKTITQSRIDAAKAWEEAQRTSLSAQIAGLKQQMQEDAAEHKEQMGRAEARAAKDSAEARDSIAKARESLHSLRDEAQAEQSRLKLQILELTEELQATRKDLNATRAEYRRLMEATAATNKAAKRNQERLDRIDPSGSRDDMPVNKE